MQHLLSQNLSPAQDFPTFSVHTALVFGFESEGVMGSFDSRSEYFQNQGYKELKRFTKVHFYVLRCLKMPRILVIMIDTFEHWQFQNAISLHTLLRQSLRKVTEPKLQKYIVLGPQKGLKHSNVPLLGEPRSGEMDLSSLCDQKWHRWGALAHPMKSSVTPDMSPGIFQW